MSAEAPGRPGIRSLGAGRYLVAASLLASIGLGMYAPGSLLFFTRVAHLSVSSVGLGLSAAGVVALVASVPAGDLADRAGARRLAVAAGLAQAALLTVLVFVRSVPSFLLVMSALAVAEQAGHVARGALVAKVADAGGRVAVNAYMRSAFNLGLTGGILAAGAVIALDTTAGYYALVLTNAAVSLLAAALLARVPVPAEDTEPEPATGPATDPTTDRAADPTIGPATAAPDATAGGRRWQGLTDLPYLGVAVLCGLVSLADVALSVGLPLWVVTYTHAPRPLAAWLLAVNTAMIVLLQVRASRGVDTVDAARRRLVPAALLSGAACVLFGLAYGVPAVAASALLLLAVVVLTVGELWSSAASWSLRYGLAPEHAQGAYGGVFSLASGVRTMLGPALVTMLMTGLRGWGWGVLGGLFVLLAMLVAPVISVAERTRGRLAMAPAGTGGTDGG